MKRARDRDRRLLVQTGAEGEHQRLVVRERHAVCVPCVTTDFGDETVLVLCAGLEPAFAMKHLFHDSSHRTYEGRSTSGQDRGNPTAMCRRDRASASFYRTQSWSMSMLVAAGLYW